MLVPLGIIPVFLYQSAGIKWINIPWGVVALLGTATAFTVGFKNTQTYKRTIEAQHIWTNIASLSWIWGTVCRYFINDAGKTKELIYRHLAWLTALRYQMREERVWETADKKHNAEYQRYYTVPERETLLETELTKYMPGEEALFYFTQK